MNRRRPTQSRSHGRQGPCGCGGVAIMGGGERLAFGDGVVALGGHHSQQWVGAVHRLLLPTDRECGFLERLLPCRKEAGGPGK